jgi:hypothetical protein
MRITRADFLNLRSGEYLDAIARSDTNLLLLRPSSSAVDGRLLSVTSLEEQNAAFACYPETLFVTVRGIWDNSKDFPWLILLLLLQIKAIHCKEPGMYPTAIKPDLLACSELLVSSVSQCRRQ